MRFFHSLCLHVCTCVHTTACIYWMSTRDSLLSFHGDCPEGELGGFLVRVSHGPGMYSLAVKWVMNAVDTTCTTCCIVCTFFVNFCGIHVHSTYNVRTYMYVHTCTIYMYICTYYLLLITWPTANHTPWKWSPDQALNHVMHTFLCNNQIIHTFSTLTLTWSLSAAWSHWENCDVNVAPWQNQLGARTTCKRTGMCLAIVYMISNKTLSWLFGL